MQPERMGVVSGEVISRGKKKRVMVRQAVCRDLLYNKISSISLVSRFLYIYIILHWQKF